MEQARREALEAAGFRVGDAADFLGLTEEERRFVDLRVALVVAIVERRQARGLSQAALAELMGSSLPRVARLEAGGRGVSLDLAFRALFALGGGLEDLRPATNGANSTSKKRRASSKLAGPRRAKAGQPTTPKIIR